MDLPTEELSVGGSLHLSYWAGRQALPKTLCVGESLFLMNWAELKTLPENLTVGRALILRGCSALMFIPENTSFGGDLELTNCTSLTTLPNWITTLGATSGGLQRRIFLENTGLSDTLIDRLRTTTTEGMQFHFSRPQKQTKQIFTNIKQGFTFWRDLVSSDAEIPELNLNQFDEQTLINYLGRLTGTADYQNKVSRALLADRVMVLMSLLTKQ